MRHWFSLLILTIVTGCSPEQKVTGQIIIQGSNTFGEELGPRLITAFRQRQPAVTVELESKGSGAGFTALLAGECDIAAGSRPINEDEQRQAKSRGIKLNQYVIGSYGVAVIVNKENPVTGLRHEQVRDIFTGAVTNWKEVGGPAAPIHIFIRDPVAGTYLGFQELAMDRRPYVESAKQFKTYAEIVEAVRHDPHAIGYAGMNFLSHEGIKALPINGIQPSITTVNEDQYPYSRSLRFFTNTAKETAATRALVSFVQSRKAQRIVSDMGFVRRLEPRFWMPDM